MKIEKQIDVDLKQAMLSGDKNTTETLRGLKSALHNEAIAASVQEAGLADQQVQKILATEAKKRSEAAEVYQKAGAADLSNKELLEKKIIDGYLPAQMDEEALKALVDKHMAALNASSMADMGKVIGAVKAEAGAAADGATVAKLVREKLQ